MKDRVEVSYRVLTQAGVPDEAADLAYGGDRLTIVRRGSTTLLFESNLSSDKLVSASLFSTNGVSLDIECVTSGRKMVAVRFESSDEARAFYAWVRGDKTAASVPGTFRAVIPRANVTTLLELPGWKIVRSLGVVTGIHVRSAGSWGNFTANLKSIVGGSLGSFIELSRDARSVAYDAMIAEATALGANAVYGVRYDANDVVEGATEIMCYGTAAIVEPVGRDDQGADRAG